MPRMKRRSIKDFEKIGGYDWGLYYNINEVDKLTIENLKKAIEFLKRSIRGREE